MIMATTETTTASEALTVATQSFTAQHHPDLDLDLNLKAALDVDGNRHLDESQLKSPPNMGCPTCGFDDMRYYERDVGLQRRIGELESQIRLSNDKAAASAEKLADYEDEIQYLRSQSNLQPPTVFPPTPSYTPPSLHQRSQSSSPPHQQEQQQQPEQQQPQTRLATIASYLPYGKRNNNNNTAHQSSSSLSLPFSTSRPSSSGDSPTSLSAFPLPPNNHLQDALSREQELRKDAESRLSQANSELEDLTAQLFSQANEMVAEERRARAKLEERVDVLERRDKDKRERLDRLEQAIERVDRVRRLVGPAS